MRSCEKLKWMKLVTFLKALKIIWLHSRSMCVIWVELVAIPLKVGSFLNWIYTTHMAAFPHILVCWRLRKSSQSIIHLSGTLSNEPANLRSCQCLDLRSSYFTENLPTLLTWLSWFFRNELSDSSISGKIPNDVGNLQVVEFLHFG